MKKTIITCVTIIGIVVLEMYALNKGINGVLLTTVIALLAGMTGYIMPQPKIMK